MILSAFVLKLDAKNAWRVFKRDRYKSTSPNSGQTETVCAGALGIELLGDTYYFGKLVKKPAVGDAARSIKPDDIHNANKLMYCMAFIMVVFVVAARLCFWLAVLETV